MKKNKIIEKLDKIILLSFYSIVYFLPISKALIEIFVYFSIFCYIIKKILQRQFILKAKFNLVIFLYLIICLFSIFLSTNFKTSMRAFLGKPLTNIAIFLIIIDTLNDKRRIKTFVYLMLLSSLLLGIDGIYQYFTHKDFIRHRPYYGLPRIHATFPTSNDFGCYLISVIPFVIALFFSHIKTKVFKYLISLLFILLFICLILTLSRGAWFAFITTILFMSIWIWPLGVFIFILGICIIALQQFYFPMLKKRLDSFFVFADHSAKDRIIMWETAWRMFLWNPWFGLGLGTFMFNFRRFLITEYRYGVPYAHNCYLQIAAETGIIGLLTFLSILILFFSYGIKTVSKHRHKKEFAWYILLASLAAVLGFCVQMSVDTSFYSLDLGILFWLLLGLGVSAKRQLEIEMSKK